MIAILLIATSPRLRRAHGASIGGIHHRPIPLRRADDDDNDGDDDRDHSDHDDHDGHAIIVQYPHVVMLVMMMRMMMMMMRMMVMMIMMMVMIVRMIVMMMAMMMISKLLFITAIMSRILRSVYVLVNFPSKRSLHIEVEWYVKRVSASAEVPLVPQAGGIKRPVPLIVSTCSECSYCVVVLSIDHKPPRHVVLCMFLWTGFFRLVKLATSGCSMGSVC